MARQLARLCFFREVITRNILVTRRSCLALTWPQSLDSSSLAIFGGRKKDYLSNTFPEFGSSSEDAATRAAAPVAAFWQVRHQLLLIDRISKRAVIWQTRPATTEFLRAVHRVTGQPSAWCWTWDTYIHTLRVGPLCGRAVSPFPNKDPARYLFVFDSVYFYHDEAIPIHISIPNPNHINQYGQP